MVRDPGLIMRGSGWTIARRLTGGYVPSRYYCSDMRMEFLGWRTSDTWGTIYPASGPRRENPTCCLSDLVLMMMYMGALRALGERDLCSPMRGGCVEMR